MRRFVVTTTKGCEWSGTEFEVEDDATDDEIAEAAWEAVSERLSFGWEEVTE